MKKKSRISWGTIVTRLLMILWSLFILIPLYIMFLTSVKSSTEFYAGLWSLPKDIFANIAENFPNAWAEASLGTGYVNTLLITGGALALEARQPNGAPAQGFRSRLSCQRGRRRLGEGRGHGPYDEGHGASDGRRRDRRTLPGLADRRAGGRRGDVRRHHSARARTGRRALSVSRPSASGCGSTCRSRGPRPVPCGGRVRP